MPAPHKNYRFNIKDIRVTFISFAVNEAFRLSKEEPVEITTQVALNSNYDRKRKELSLGMGIRQAKKDAPFAFEVRGTGLFRFEKNPDEETLEKISTINCPAIIFPYLREVVADLTRRGGFAPLHLAPVNFVAMAEERKKMAEADKKKELKSK